MLMAKQQNEHLGIYGVIVNDKDKILLIKKARGPYKGLLDLPGGRPEFEETLEETLKREVLEETGLQVTSCKQLETAVKIVEDEDANMRHTAIIYAAEATGVVKPDGDNEDSAGAMWYSVKDIGNLKITWLALHAIDNFLLAIC